MATESKSTAAIEPAVTLGELASAQDHLELAGDPLTPITGITYDSRAVSNGCLFVALKGGYFDGHAFLHDAVASGAAAVLVEDDHGIAIPTIKSTDTRASLAPIAATFYARPSEGLNVIGVTGTDGKTTTTYLVDDILRFAGKVTGAVGTVSVRIAGEVVEHETRQTTPESLDVQRYLRQMVDAGVDTAILEATSHGLDLHRLDNVNFAIGAVTNITHEHLEHHRTVAAYRRAKGILFEKVSANKGVAIINLDDEGAREMLPLARHARILTYSMNDVAADISADLIKSTAGGSTFKVKYQDQIENVDLPMIGGFNVANALCAIGIALACDIDIATSTSSLRTASTVPGRLARISAGQPFSVFVDYAHTPESLTKVLQLLRDLNPVGRLIAVSGSAGERDVSKRPLQGGVSQRLADVSIFTTEDPRFEDADAIIADIAVGARAANGIEGETYHCVTDRRDAIRLALTLAGAGDVVLLAGKGHERSIIWGQEKLPWDESAVARELLHELGFLED